MAKSREQKEQEVANLTARLKDSSAAVLTDYHGLSVREQQELQANLKEAGMRFQVIKLTLFQRAAKEAGLKTGELKGPVGLAIGADDPVAIAKAVDSFAKEHEALEITGGFVDKAPVDIELIKRYAALPGREELLARLVGSIGGPIRNVASGLSAVSRNLVYALNAVKEGKS